MQVQEDVAREMEGRSLGGELQEQQLAPRKHAHKTAQN
jgi:hypothetical protein